MPAFLDDLRAVMWKEWRELGDQFDTRSKGNVIILTLVIIQFSVVTPVFIGPSWLSSAALLMTFPLLASTISVQPTVDGFAGERERHTLETLLASRLRDRAILWGKMLSSFIPSVIVGLLMFMIGVVSINIAHGHGRVLLPPAWATLGVGLITPLFCGFSIAAGIFVSLRAATVRQAAQNFGYIFVAVMLTPIIVPLLLPAAWRERALEGLKDIGGVRVVLLVAAVFLVIDAVFLLAADRRFRRGRLTLD